MKEETKKILLLSSIVLCLLVIAGLALFSMTLFEEPYKLHLDGGKCNIGKPEIAGDYKVENDNLNPLNIGDSRACAIKDCNLYNDYQLEIGSGARCVV